jgi:hypothetical protein
VSRFIKDSGANHYAECVKAEYCYAVCHYAEYHYAECLGASEVAKNIGLGCNNAKQFKTLYLFQKNNGKKSFFL